MKVKKRWKNLKKKLKKLMKILERKIMNYKANWFSSHSSLIQKLQL